MKHPCVIRTSPKGQPFLGTCQACGKTGIKFEAVSTEECENWLRMSNEQALIRAIEG